MASGGATITNGVPNATRDGQAPQAVSSPQLLHYHCNHLGTPEALIDRSGKIVWQAEFDPWGNVRSEFNPQQIDQPIRMQGQQLDLETGLFYNRYRYYAPQMGRYVTQDPIGLAGGFNKSRYVSDPVQWIDPLGLDPTSVPSSLPGQVGKHGKSWWDKAREAWNYEESIEAGRQLKIKQDTLMCKAEKEMEERVNSEQITPQAAEQALAAKKITIYSGETVSAGRESATSDGLITRMAKGYGYWSAPEKNCTVLLAPNAAPPFDFFKK